MRLAMDIAYQDGMSKSEVRELYEQVCLGEITISKMLQEIADNLSNQTLKDSLQILKLGSNTFK